MKTKFITFVLLLALLVVACNKNTSPEIVKSKDVLNNRKYTVEVHRILESRWSPDIEINTIKKFRKDQNVLLKLILHKPEKNSYTENDHELIKNINCMGTVLDYNEYLNEWGYFIEKNKISEKISEKCRDYKYKAIPLKGRLPETTDLVYVTVNNEQIKGIPRSNKIAKHLCEKYMYKCEKAAKLGAEDITLFILNDKNCKDCAVNMTFAMFYDIYPGIKSELIDLSSEKGQKLYNSFFNKPLLPAFIFSNNLKDDELFSYFQPFFEIVKDKYLFKTNIHNWDPNRKKHITKL